MSYHCYSCSKKTVVTTSQGTPTCKRCGSEFVEELPQTQARGARQKSTSRMNRVPQDPPTPHLPGNAFYRMLPVAPTTSPCPVPHSSPPQQAIQRVPIFPPISAENSPSFYDSKLVPPPTRDLPPVPGQRTSLSPVRAPGPDQDELYSLITLPETNFIDLSEIRFKADRGDSLYSNSQAPQTQEIETQTQPEVQPEAAIEEFVDPGEPSSAWNFFTGIVDAVREGIDRLDELTFVIAPEARSQAQFQLIRFRGGSPPAAVEEVQCLKTISITGEEMVNQKDCPICCLDWELEESARVMPCGHCFHEECLMPWLKERNSCPICRYELATEDRTYERYKEYRQNF